MEFEPQSGLEERTGHPGWREAEQAASGGERVFDTRLDIPGDGLQVSNRWDAHGVLKC